MMKRDNSIDVITVLSPETKADVVGFLGYSQDN